MLAYIAYYKILGLPLVAIIGIVTYSLFVFTALIPILIRKGKISIPVYWHWRLAYVAIAMATVHGLLVVLSY